MKKWFCLIKRSFSYFVIISIMNSTIVLPGWAMEKEDLEAVKPMTLKRVGEKEQQGGETKKKIKKDKKTKEVSITSGIEETDEESAFPETDEESDFPDESFPLAGGGSNDTDVIDEEDQQCQSRWDVVHRCFVTNGRGCATLVQPFLKVLAWGAAAVATVLSVGAASSEDPDTKSILTWATFGFASSSALLKAADVYVENEILYENKELTNKTEEAAERISLMKKDLMAMKEYLTHLKNNPLPRRIEEMENPLGETSAEPGLIRLYYLQSLIPFEAIVNNQIVALDLWLKRSGFKLED